MVLLIFRLDLRIKLADIKYIDLLIAYSGWWFGTWLLFSHILGIIIPTDFHIFQRGRYTTNQYFFFMIFPGKFISSNWGIDEGNMFVLFFLIRKYTKIYIPFIDFPRGSRSANLRSPHIFLQWTSAVDLSWKAWGQRRTMQWKGGKSVYIRDIKYIIHILW